MNEKLAGQSSGIRELYVILCVHNGAAAIEFYKKVFDAEEIMRLAEPGGKIAHAELKIGTTVIMLADEHPDHDFLSPKTIGGSGMMIHLHVDDVDTLARRAQEAGATILRGPSDESHGERQCLLKDPFGHRWLLGHQTEDITNEDIKRRFERQGHDKKT
jgi:PhnB protein